MFLAPSSLCAFLCMKITPQIILWKEKPGGFCLPKALMKMGGNIELWNSLLEVEVGLMEGIFLSLTKCTVHGYLPQIPKGKMFLLFSSGIDHNAVVCSLAIHFVFWFYVFFHSLIFRQTALLLIQAHCCFLSILGACAERHLQVLLFLKLCLSQCIKEESF